MSSMSPESAVAGRLEVLVESELRGFGRKLKKKVEAATKGVEGKVQVEPETKGLKRKIKTKVEEASAGVTAKIGVEVDDASVAGFKAKVEAIAKAAGTQVKVTVDSDGLVSDTVKASAEAEAAADANPVRVPLRTKGKLWLEALREKLLAQKAVDGGSPIEVPVTVGGGGRRPRLRGFLRGGILVGLLSIVQPAVGAIGQLVGGLTAMAGAIGPAAGTLAALPLGMSALITTMAGVTIGAGGVGDAFKALAQQQAALADGQELTKEQLAETQATLDRLSPSAQKFVRRVLSLKDEWAELRKEVQEPLFAPIAEQVEPFANTILPRLEKGLSRTGKVVGNFAARFMLLAQTPRFLSNFSGIMRQNNRTIEAGGDATLDLLRGFMEFQRAAAPFQRRMDGWIRRSARWFADTMRLNRENGDTAAFLEKAGDRLAQVWNITKQAGSGILGIFRAGETSGVRLLTSFERFLTKWNTWVNSPEGQARIESWFANVEPGFREMGRMVRDTFNAIARWAEDPKIANMLRMLRTELGPALNEFLTALSDMMGQNVVDFFTELTRALNNLQPALEVISSLTGLLIDLVGVANDLAEAGGGLTDALLTIGGALFAFSKAKKVLGLLGGKRAKGGLLGNLFGTGAKAATAAGAAKGFADVSSKAGKFGGVLTRLSRMPLMQKAGWAGIVLGGFEVADQWQHIAHNVEDGARRAGDAAGGMKGDVVDAARRIRDELAKSDVGKNADKFDLDLDKLAASIATDGKYVRKEMKRLADDYSQTWEIIGDVAPWQSKHAANRRIREDLDSIIETYKGRRDDLRKQQELFADLIREGPGGFEGAFRNARRNAAQTAREEARKMRDLWKKFQQDSIPASLRNPKLGIPKALQRPEGMPVAKPQKPLIPAESIVNMRNVREQAARVKETLRRALSFEGMNEARSGAPGAFDWGKFLNVDGITKSIRDAAARAKEQAAHVKDVLRRAMSTEGGATGARAAGRAAPTAKVDPPKVDLAAARRQAQHVRDVMRRAMTTGGGGGGKAAGKIAPPKIDAGAMQRDAQRASRSASRTLTTAFKGKKIPPPKLNTAPIRRDVQQTGNLITRTFNRVKIKPIKAPKINGKPAETSAKATGRNVAKSLTKGGQDAAKGMQKGMTSVVTAIRSKQGPARGASQGVANASKAPFQGLAGAFYSLGANAMQGLVNGIQARGAAAVAAARSIAAQVAAASRSALDVRSPSRVMMKIGEFVSEGFALGIIRGTRKVGKARKRLTQMLTKRGWSAKERGKFFKATADEFRGLERMARRWESVTRRLELARKGQFDALIRNGKKRKEFTKTLREGQRDFGSLTTLSEFGGGFLSPSFAIAELTRRVSQSDGFRKTLRKLRKRGLGNKAYRQLLEAGVEQGAPIAEQLLGATPEQLRQINRLQNRLVKAATGMGADAGKKMRAVGGAITDGMVQGLVDNKRGLSKAAKSMAEHFVRAIRKALKIKSPSRVMAGVGVDTVAGMSVGVNKQAKRLVRDARRVSADVARSLTPETHARDLYAASRGSKMRHFERAATAQLAPLVGELNITGQTKEEIRDALDEALFALRKIRSGGGVHAVRTA